MSDPSTIYLCNLFLDFIHPNPVKVNYNFDGLLKGHFKNTSDFLCDVTIIYLSLASTHVKNSAVQK